MATKNNVQQAIKGMVKKQIPAGKLNTQDKVPPDTTSPSAQMRALQGKMKDYQTKGGLKGSYEQFSSLGSANTKEEYQNIVGKMKKMPVPKKYAPKPIPKFAPLPKTPPPSFNKKLMPTKPIERRDIDESNYPKASKIPVIPPSSPIRRDNRPKLI